MREPPSIPRSGAGSRDRKVSRPLVTGAYEQRPVQQLDGASPGAGRVRTAEREQAGESRIAASVDAVAESPVEPFPRAHPAEAEPGRTGLSPIRIGLWGGPGSGKTTFIGVLRTAVEQRLRRTGEAWSVVAADNASLEFMQTSEQSLRLEKRFPTFSIQHNRYSFLFRGEIPPPVRKLRLRPAKPHQVEFELSVYDRPGSQYADKYLREHPELIDDLADCDGLLYLFDPLNVQEDRDSLIYFQATLARLASEVNRRGGFVGAKLPHHLAVCITKFDDKKLFDLARTWGLLGTHPTTGETRVLDGDAAKYFNKLCDESTGTAEYVRDAIGSYFRPDRVRYYVVASIGYNRGAKNLEFEDTTNAGELEDGVLVIRSNLHPINVVEPIVDLERMIRLGTAR